MDIPSHDAIVEIFEESQDFTLQSVYDSIYLANLTFLILHLTELSASWTTLSPEQKTLAIDSILMVFPSRFLPEDAHQGTDEANVIMELRSQVFIQEFLNCTQNEDLGEWDTEQKIKEAFALDTEDQTKVPNVPTASPFEIPVLMV